jgi:DeoR/GlpR family transcriptional regulator of sugar metabolism
VSEAAPFDQTRRGGSATIAFQDKPSRWRQVLRLLEAEGFVTVASLGRRLGASEPTVRRDLAALERQGFIRRVRGGAVAPGPGESPFAERMRLHAAAKQAIAARAAQLVEPGQSIALDIGTTMVYLAQNIADRGLGASLRIVTNGLHTARALARNGLTVVVTGGVLRPGEDSLVGPVARRAVRGYRFDAYFLSAAALSERGVVDVNMDEIEVKQEFLVHSRCVYALLDGDKLGADVAGLPAFGLGALNAVVTDGRASESRYGFLRDAGVNVIVATP